MVEKARSAGTLLLGTLVLLGSLFVVPVEQVGAAVGDAPVTGSLFVDLDRDGVFDAGEGLADTDSLSPPAGVTVTAWDASGGSVACVVSPGAPPTYSCPVAGLSGSDFRIEFALDPADEALGYSYGPSGVDNGTDVQFVTAGETGADFATVPPSQCPTTGEGFGGNANTADGKVWTTCFTNGDRDADGPQDVLVGLNYDRTGAVEKLGLKGDGNDAVAAADELGSVWGIAYDEWNSTLFTSAFLKRHVQLGSQGIDGLYWMDYPSGAWNSIALDSISGGPDFGLPFSRDLEGVGSIDPSHDVEAYDLVGSAGIGDIDVTPDGRTLLVTNLTAKTVEVYDISGVPTGGQPVWSQSIPISNPGCPDAAAHPDDYEIFAVKSKDGSTAYIGVTCTARTSQDFNNLAAFVVPITIGGAEGAPVLNVPLNYYHQCTWALLCPDPAHFAPWPPVGQWWESRFDHQPWLTDLEFTADGSLVLGFADRLGHTGASENYRNDPTDFTLVEKVETAGEILHACNTSGDPNNPVWVLEGAAGSVCDPFNNFPGDGSKGAFDHWGPGGNAEWYGEDRFNVRRNAHLETSNGGLYVHPYLDEVVMSAMDPTNWTSGGLEWFSNVDGSLIDGYELYEGRITEGYLGKAGGIGDVEGCFIPIEIGNFVWLDLDGDGIQDPGETPLAGVTVTLFDAAGNVVATTTTGPNGEYYFDSADGVEANTAYTIGFDVLTNTTPLPGGFTNADLVETFANNAGTADNSDSDVVNGQVAIMTGASGMNDHSFDAGFTLPKVFDLALQKQLADGTNLGGVSPGDSVTFTITLFNQGTVDGSNITVTDYLPASGLTLADPDWTDQGDGTATSIYPGPLTPGTTIELDITFTVDADASGQINNWAEISAADPTDENGGIHADPTTGLPLTDIDSTPDAMNTDVGPIGPNAPGDDTIDEDGLNGGDEDDHDVAGITIIPTFDLALQKQLADGTNLGAVMPGDTVTFTITVFNQGTVDGSNITVTDYLPASGLTLADSAWTDNGNGTAQISIPGPVAPGGSTTVDITFTVDADASGQINNWAEISEAIPTDDSGATVIDPSTGVAAIDIDSTPDAMNTDVGPTGPNAPGDDTIDEDGLNGGDEDDHDVAGVTIGETYSVGNQVWFDDNNNGIIDPGETPIEGVWVELFTDVDGDGQPDDLNGDGVIDVNDAVATTGTDADGNYLFDGLAPGDYIVGIPPMEFDAGGPLEGTQSSDPTSTDPNDDVDNDDNGMVGPGGYIISGPVTIGDGEPTGEVNDNDPTTPDANENLTVDFGFYTPEETYSLGNQVWFDDNNNGVIDPGEEPIEGVWVELFVDADGDGQPDDLNGDGVIDVNDAVATTGTDADGNYLFDGLAPGDYIVGIPPMEFDAGGPLEGTQSSDPTSTDPNDDVDNDDNGMVGPGGYIISGPVTIGDGEPTGEVNDNDPTTPDANENLTVDFGFYTSEETYSVGNQVWFDTNNNGIIDPGETPIEGVWVELFVDVDGDGQPDDLNGDGVIDVNDAVATTGTDADGNYLFDGLAPGDYIVGIPPMEWEPGGPLYGYLSSDPTSTDPNDDVDNDDNGFAGPGGYVWSGPVTIGDGEPTGEVNDNDPNTPDANENLTVDFGFYQPVFDMALFKQLADGSNLATVNPGDEVTFTLSIVNQGTVSAADLTIVDYLPAGLTLADADWTKQSDGTATIMVAGPIAAGTTATVDITFTVNADATGPIDNWAEIAAGIPVDVMGNSITMPNGNLLPDIDSVPDADNSDAYDTDDNIDGSGINGGDEDDHDIAQIIVNQGSLAFTGSNATNLALVALATVLAGSFALVLAMYSRRREEQATIS